MMVRPINSSFARYTRRMYEDDSGTDCSVCGYGIFHGDDVERDENGQSCHTKCLNQYIEEQKHESENSFQ